MNVLHEMFSFDSTEDEQFLMTVPEVGEEDVVSKALLFQNGNVSVIPGSSSDLNNSGYRPYNESHFNTQFALTVTQALATLHGVLRSKGLQMIEDSEEESSKSVTGREVGSRLSEASNSSAKNYTEREHTSTKDIWTHQVSRPTIISANLSIMCSQFREENVSQRIIDKLESLQSDLVTFSQFMQFASTMQANSHLQSVGPISMCDIWVPNSYSDEDSEYNLVIRLRGGKNLKAPPMRDVTWMWLTLLRPDILEERYMELCDSYCTAFNSTVLRYNATKSVEELTLFDVMRDLGDSFLHAFFTIVHKFTLSGVWCLDRSLHTSEGIRSISESLRFLIDNGIIGSLLVV